MVADPNNTLGEGPIALQPQYWYMGHFSRYVPPGAVRVDAIKTFDVPEASVHAEVRHRTDIPGTFEEHSGNIRGTFREHPGTISRNIQRKSS
jgi:hypothetical protein